MEWPTLDKRRNWPALHINLRMNQQPSGKEFACAQLHQEEKFPSVELPNVDNTRNQTLLLDQDYAKIS